MISLRGDTTTQEPLELALTSIGFHLGYLVSSARCESMTR